MNQNAGTEGGFEAFVCCFQMARFPLFDISIRGKMFSVRREKQTVYCTFPLVRYFLAIHVAVAVARIRRLKSSWPEPFVAKYEER